MEETDDRDERLSSLHTLNDAGDAGDQHYFALHLRRYIPNSSSLNLLLHFTLVVIVLEIWRFPFRCACTKFLDSRRQCNITTQPLVNITGLRGNWSMIGRYQYNRTLNFSYNKLG